MYIGNWYVSVRSVIVFVLGATGSAAAVFFLLLRPSATPVPTNPTAQQRTVVAVPDNQVTQYRELLTGFDAKTSVTVIGYTPDKLDSVLTRREGSTPQVAVVAQNQLAGLFQRGRIVPAGIALSEGFDDDVAATFTLRGVSHGVPLLGAGYAVVRNTALVKEAPGDVAELLTLLESAKVDKPKRDPGGVSDTEAYYLDSLLQVFGGYSYSSNSDVGLDKESLLTNASLLQQLAQAMAGASSDATTWRDRFLAGEVGVYVTTPSVAQDLGKSKLDVAVSPLPVIAGAAGAQRRTVAYGAALTAAGAGSAGARELLSWLATAKAQSELSALLYLPPLAKGAKVTDPVVSAFMELQSDAPFRVYAAPVAAGFRVGRMWTSLLDGDDAKRALTTAAEDVRKIVYCANDDAVDVPAWLDDSDIARRLSEQSSYCPVPRALPSDPGGVGS